MGDAAHKDCALPQGCLADDANLGEGADDSEGAAPKSNGCEAVVDAGDIEHGSDFLSATAVLAYEPDSAVGRALVPSLLFRRWIRTQLSSVLFPRTSLSGRYCCIGAMKVLMPLGVRASMTIMSASVALLNH